MTILEVNGVKKVYTTRFGTNQITALKNVNFSVEQGEYVAVMGESGSGKTTYKLEHYIGLLERKPRSVFQAKPVRQTVKKELLELGKQLPGGNRDMVRLLRMCVDYGEYRVIFAKNQIPVGITPTIDIIRSYLEDPEKDAAIRFRNEVYITQTNLMKWQIL